MVIPDRAWLVFAFADERQYRGNDGYQDILERRYMYDSNVPNSRNVQEGDVLIVSGVKRVLGTARVERIESALTTKTVRRCPYCRTSGIKARSQREPTFRCNAGHEFREPFEDAVSVTRFAADFGDSFIPVPHGVSRRQALEACPAPRAQLSIRRIDLEQLWPLLLGVAPHVARVGIQDAPGAYLSPAEAALPDDMSADVYQSTDLDTRIRAMRLISERRGQATFRNRLRERYGDRCMISGCKLMEVVEAAHISPYRGNEDHHPENGLLLRADIHTLFDLDLLGIDPDSLQVRLHPRVCNTGYGSFEGTGLRCCEPHLPSRPALISRWRRFRERLG